MRFLSKEECSCRQKEQPHRRAKLAVKKKEIRNELGENTIRQALFFHSISDIPTASEWYCPSGSDIVRLRLSVIFYSPPKLAQRISLGVSRISLRSNRTRQRRIELGRYSAWSISPWGCSFLIKVCKFRLPWCRQSRWHAEALQRGRDRPRARS